MKKVTTLILPVAGLGKRLLPLTKRTPKSLVPVNKKPILEYALHEAVESGIRDVVLVVHPKYQTAFAAYLKKNGKKFPTLQFHIRTQHTPGGNGHAIAQAYDIVGDEPFAVRFCDDMIPGSPSVLKSLIDIFAKKQASVMLLERVSRAKVSSFGVVGFKKQQRRQAWFGGAMYEVTALVEKPKAKDAPSNLIIVGGYVFTPEIMRSLRMVAATLPSVANDALPIAVALQIELIVRRKIYGWEFPGRRLDCGNLESLRQAEAFLRANH